MKKYIILLFLSFTFINHIYAHNCQDKELERRVDQYLQPILNIGSFSGTILISKHGEIVLNKSYGYADYTANISFTPDTKSYLGSNSKTITAIAIMLLADKGLLKVTDSVSRFVPGIPGGDKITIHQLLTHTSGITFDLPFIVNEQKDPGIWSVHRSLADQIDLLKQVPAEAAPGTKTIYSNNNYRLLAYIIEKASGLSFGEFLQKNIFRPCDMKSTRHNDGTDKGIKNIATGYSPEGATGVRPSFPMDWNNKIGHASIYSTTEDMQKLYEALFAGKLVSHASLEKMCTGYASSSAGTYGYGLFVWPQKIYENSVYGFNGRSPGFSAEMRYFKEEDVFIAIMSNNYSSPVIQMASNISALVFNQPLEPFYGSFNISKPFTVSNEVLDTYTGDYEGGADFVMKNAKLKVIRKDNDLIILWQLSGGRESILVPQSEDSFLDKTFWATLRFLKDENGKVNKIEYQSRGKVYTAEKKNW